MDGREQTWWYFAGVLIVVAVATVVSVLFVIDPGVQNLFGSC